MLSQVGGERICDGDTAALDLWVRARAAGRGDPWPPLDRIAAELCSQGCAHLWADACGRLIGAALLLDDFRPLLIIPIAIILGLISGAGQTVTNTIVLNEVGDVLQTSQRTAGGLASGLVIATALMIIVRQRYPRWWFDFARELTRFAYRVGAYLALLTDQYPSTVDAQAVHLELDYPEAQQDLNRWLPLIKWLLAIPHYIVLAVLAIGAVVAVIGAWFAILAAGRYPKALFDYVVGVGRWALRVNAYAFLLVTDRYPPFSLD